jgi:lipid II:glycine glycyltransferase (peptidoglycan interpeptide bridge formation enzyme)
MSGTPSDLTWDDAVLTTQLHPHFMQSQVWARFKDGSAWLPHEGLIRDTSGKFILAIQEFTREAFGIGTLIHAPRVSGISIENLTHITEHARNYAGNNLLAFKLEPYQDNDPALTQAFLDQGWVPSYASQYDFSIIVEMGDSAEELFASFSKHHRRDIRAAERANPRIERVDFSPENLATAIELIRTTEKRSGAFFRTNEYLEKVWAFFDQAGQARLYFTYDDEGPLAAAVVFTFGKKGWYKDGGSRRSKTLQNGPLLMQWRIIQDLMAEGFTHYELGNIPDPEIRHGHPMEGLYRFKFGFTQKPIEFMPAFEFPLNSKHKFWNKYETRFLGLYSRVKKDYWY